MFFSKPMKKNNSILHWENNRRPRFPKKAIAAFLAPVKMCLQMGFCFKAPAPAIWPPCSSVVPPFCTLQMACSLLCPVQPPTPRKAGSDRNTGMWNTLSPYTVTLCWRTVLRCRDWSPTATCHLPPSAWGSLGWQVVSALQVPSHWLSPQPLALGSLALPESKQGSQGQQSALNGDGLTFIYVPNRELQLTDIFYMNAIYYVVTSLCLYNEINCFVRWITQIYFLQVPN